MPILDLNKKAERGLDIAGEFEGEGQILKVGEKIFLSVALPSNENEGFLSRALTGINFYMISRCDYADGSVMLNYKS